MTMTHAQLVDRAVRWLRNSAVVCSDIEYENPRLRRKQARCKIVFAEHHSFSSEIPDAIGWFSGGSRSILIEAKTTVGDFIGDRRKEFRRRQELGVGRYRYYLTPPGLFDRTPLPDHWGLLECGPTHMSVCHLARSQPAYNATREVEMLYAALRRQHERGTD